MEERKTKEKEMEAKQQLWKREQEQELEQQGQQQSLPPQQEQQQQSRILPLLESAPTESIFDFQSSAPGLFSSLGDQSESYYHSGTSGGQGTVPAANNEMDLGLTFDIVPSPQQDPLQRLSVHISDPDHNCNHNHQCRFVPRSYLDS